MNTPPSPLWFIDRSAGEVTLLLLSSVVILGIVRAAAPTVSPLVVEGIHRRVALLAIGFGLLHALAAVLDPFAHLGPVDALVPFASSYRGAWLGWGVVSAYLYGIVALSSWPVRRLGIVWWRWLHRITYLAWIMAVVHTFGTGSDAANGLFGFLNVVAVTAVLATFLAFRVYDDSQPVSIARAAAGVAAVLVVATLAFWAFNGPLQAGWARAAGTPPGLLRSP